MRGTHNTGTKSSSAAGKLWDLHGPSGDGLSVSMGYDFIGFQDTEPRTPLTQGIHANQALIKKFRSHGDSFFLCSLKPLLRCEREQKSRQAA